MIALLLLVAFVGHAGACSDNEDCVNPNTICTFGKCTCEDGYDMQNGECTKILGRVCSRTSDCTTNYSSHISCINEVCSCDTYRWFEQENVCVSVIGRTCTSHYECGHDSNIRCLEGECNCRNGYFDDNGYCSQVIHRYCQNDTDCPMENSHCDYSYCRCNEGTGIDNYFECTQQIGGRCGNVGCSLLNNYQMLYCDVNDICSCRSNYEIKEDLTGCTPILGKICSDQEECNNSMFQCIDGKCVCADNYERAHDYYGYGMCRKKIGLTCSNTNCTLDNAVCNSENVCSCIDGFIEVNGNCQRVVGTKCVDDDFCSAFGNAICGITGVCQCMAGYDDKGGLCEKLLGKPCSIDYDCGHKDVKCSSIGNCQCRLGLVDFGGTCMRQECTQNVPKLPDIFRRMQSHRLNYSIFEPPISDQQLEEKWYSLGRNMILFGSMTLTEGDCGSRYPIYIKGHLTEEELHLMQTSEISKEMTITLTDDDPDQTINIKLRNCSGEIQMFLTKPPVRFAAYCLDNPSGTVKTTHRFYTDTFTIVYLRSELNFRTEQINGEMMEIPYIEFQCFENINIETIDDGFSFYVHWYADNVHIESYGPLMLKEIHLARLHESVLLNHGYTTGIMIQCAVQFSENIGGIKSRPKFGNRFDTGLNSYQYSSTTLDRLHLYKGIPLGCISTVGSNETHCEITMKPENSAKGCSKESSDNDNHELCGITLLGVTKLGLGIYGANPNNIYYITDNGTSTNIDYETKLLNNYLSYKANFRLTKNDSSVHNIWRGYSFMMNKVANGTDHEHPFESMSITIYRNSITTFSSSSTNAYIWVNTSTTAEYVMYRSKVASIQVNVIFEHHDYTVRFCGFVYRDHDDVYMCSTCNNTLIIGSLVGSSEHELSHSVSNRFSNGLYMSVDESQGDLSIHLSQSGQISTEGIANMKHKHFPMRNGSVSSSSAGFLESWKVQGAESLLKASNYKPYRYQYHPIVCPSSNETFEDRIHETDWQTMIYYQSALEVGANNMCTENELADEWPSSLLPTYIVEDITVRPILDFDADEPVLEFKCVFKASEDYLYKIEWKIDELSVLESDYFVGLSAESNKVTDDQLLSNLVNFFLDSEVTCGVGVYSLIKELLANFRYSPAFYPVKIQSKVVNLQRGGRTAVRVEKNIPYACSVGSNECTLEFRLFDLNDKYDCKDSTIAVISKDSCGNRIDGITTGDISADDHDYIDIVITTKNDNKYTLRDTFNLNTSIGATGKTNTIWSARLQDTITVFVRDEIFWHSRYCYSNNDPRMGTFDGVHYSNQLVDEFIMMRHKVLPIEIQMKTALCNGGFASCSCAVTIRAGRDVFTINHCDGQHITGFLMHDDQPILTIRRRSANRYQIYLPKGTMVDVYVSTWMWYLVNINIYPSPYDTENIEGLCGNYNGERKDDFQHRDGKTTDIGYGYYYYNPDEFSRSWSLIHTERWDDESLLNVERMEEILDNWKDNESLCVCPLGQADTILCSPIEDNTCTEAIDKPGETVEVGERRKRSAVRRKKDYADQLRKKHEKDMLIAKRSTREVRNYNETNEDSITEEEALEKCNVSMTENCVIYTMKDESPVQNTDELLHNCARDLMINASIDWSGESCSRLQAVIEVEISKDTDFQANNTDFVTFVSENVCVGSCTGNGECRNGSCICNEHFSSDDCSIDLRIAPTILRLQGNGLCDLKTDEDCSCIDVTTDGSVADAFCYMTVDSAYENGEFVHQTADKSSAVYNNFNEITCCVSEYSRRKRSTTAEVLAQRYTISVSNDGTNFGRSMVVNIIDTACQEIIQDSLGNDRATIRPGFCFIGGTCIPDGTDNVADQCQRCSSVTSVFDWSGEQCSRQTNTKDKGYVVIIAAVTSATLIVTVVVCAVLCYWKRSKLKRTTRSTDDHKVQSGYAVNHGVKGATRRMANYY